jgi:hypothetical protein
MVRKTLIQSREEKKKHEEHGIKGQQLRQGSQRSFVNNPFT